MGTAGDNGRQPGGGTLSVGDAPSGGAALHIRLPC